MKIKIAAPKRAMHLSIVIALVGSLLSFVATSASALPNLPATLTCGSGTYTIAVIDGETVAYGGGNCTGSVEIPEGVTVIGNSAFWSAQITAITLPNSLLRIEASAIRSTQITSLVIPANVAFIGDLGVASYGITSLTFAPNSHLTTIGQSAFQGLSITTISIPSSVTQMDATALQTFGTLSTIRFLGNAPTIIDGDPNINGGGLNGLLLNTTFLVSPGAQGFGDSSWSALPVVTPPAAPTNLVATIGAGQVSIAFTAGADNGGEITNYKYSIDNGTSFTALSPVDRTTPIVISGLTQTQYVIRIKAVNAAGDGAPSSSVTVTPNPPEVISVRAIGGVVPPFKGSTPVTTVTEANGYTGTISWSDNPSRFSATTSYTATISLSASPGYTLSGVTANFFTVSGAASVSNSANSGTITAIFPATSAARCYVLIDRQLTEGSGCSGAVVIEEGVTSIGNSAFSESSITSVGIPASVTSLGDYVFDETRSLRAVNVDSQNTDFSSDSGVLYNKEQTTLILYPSARPNPYVIPTTVTTFMPNAFMNLSGLSSLNIPAGVTSIGNYFFGNATSLRSITVDDANQNYGSVDGMLTNKAQTELMLYPISKLDANYTIPSSIQTIRAYSISGALNLMALTIPPTVRDIESNGIYSNPALTTVTISNRGLLNTINQDTFGYNRALASISVGDGVTTIRERAFQILDSLTTVVLGSSIETIEAMAFIGSPLTSINLPPSVRSIGQNAFRGTSLGTLDIPAGVTSIGDGAFDYIVPLRTVTVHSCEPPFRDLTFDNHFAGNENMRPIVFPGGSCSIGGLQTLSEATPEGIIVIPNVYFPETSFGSSSTVTVSVRNIGNATFSPFGPIGLAASGLPDYTYVTNCGSQLAANATCTITVTFSPTEENVALYDGVVNGVLNWNGYTVNVPYRQLLIASIGEGPTTRTVTVTSGENGSITPSTSNSIVDGSNATYTITPNNGYQIATVTVDSVSVSISELTTISGQTKSYTFLSVGADHTIEATFARYMANSPTITAPARINGTANTEITPVIMTVNGGTGSKTVAVAPSFSLPSGLTVSTAGRISGTPTAAGTTTTRFIVTDSVNETATATVEFVIAAVSAPVIVAPPPVPYLRTLTAPKMNLKDGKLMCTAGTYNSGFTLNGVIQGSATALFSPTNYTYNLLLNGQVQTSLSVITTSASVTWNLTGTTPGSVYSCSVTVTNNSVTSIDKSTDNTSGVSTAFAIQTKAISDADVTYKAALKVNTLAYPKALRDNRAQWSKEIAAIRANYYLTLDRIKANSGSKMVTDPTTAYNVMVAAKAKSNAVYAASKPAALAAKNAADKAALDAKTSAIAKAKSVYGTFIESIGYGVLIP